MPLISNNIHIGPIANVVVKPLPIVPHNSDFMNKVEDFITHQQVVEPPTIVPVVPSVVQSSPKKEEIIEKPPEAKTKKKLEDSLPPLEEITQIPTFLAAKKLKSDQEHGYVLVDGMKRKLNKSSPYLLDNVSLV